MALVHISEISIAKALTHETPYSVAKIKEPTPCEVCGKMLEPVVVPELNVCINRPNPCDDCRKKKQDEEAAEQARRDEQYRRENIERELLRVGVPQAFLKYSFTGGAKGPITWAGSTKEVAAVCMAYSLRAEGALILMGLTGRGKTHLAVSILREVLLKGKRGRFVSCLDMMTSLRSLYQSRNGEDDGSEEALLNRLGRGLIVMDDLAATRVTPIVRETFTLIVDRCERNGQPLIVTTNLSIRDIGEQIDERLASRLVGLVRAPERLIMLQGRDHRMQEWQDAQSQSK